MSRELLTIQTGKDRARASDLCWEVPAGTRILFIEPKRSIPQNDRLWLILGEISKQLLWHREYRSEDDWKDYFMHALKGGKWMPDEDGGMVPVGRSSSKLGKTEFSDLMTLIEAFCARHNVKLPWDVAA